jgi:hypothetical protein
MTKIWDKLHPEKVKASRIKWAKANADKIQAYKTEYKRIRFGNDINYKLSILLRNRIYKALKRRTKNTPTLNLIGCSVDELRCHLERLFQPGMSWANWSRTGWHVDHVKPISSFDLSNPEELSKACHYTNLQPLWAKVNHRKSNKLT